MILYYNKIIKTIITSPTSVGIMEIIMNVKNNKRRKASQEKIQRAFMNRLQGTDIHRITVADICKDAQINRSTFYANYLDVYDLADKLHNELSKELEIVMSDVDRENPYNADNFLRMLYHIKENQLFYKTYFKLGYDNQPVIYQYDEALARKYKIDKNVVYHIEFFKSGFNAVIKKWLFDGCAEPPEEISQIFVDEYRQDNWL